MILHENAMIDQLGLERIFDEEVMTFDLRQGVIWNPAKTKIVILSTDLLQGVYSALVDEAGEAWALIFQNCGRIWGERMARRLDRETASVLGARMSDMPLKDFLGFISSYFVFHGWGQMQIEVERAPETGLVEAYLAHSIFAEIVRDDKMMADPMIAGILGSLVAHLSGREMMAVQTACMTKGAERSSFLIGVPERLKEAEDLVRAGKTHEELLNEL